MPKSGQDIVPQTVTHVFLYTDKSSQSVFTLALLVHLSLSSIVMLLPILLLLITNPQSRLASPRAIEADPWKLLPPIGEFSLYFIILSLISTLIAGNWAWIPQTWGATCVTTLKSSFSYLRPNFALLQVDPFWPDAKYRAVVVFLHRDVWLFSTFLFDGLFSASHHLCGSNLFKVPVRDSFLLIRVRNRTLSTIRYDALYASFIILGILGTFKAYATLSDPGLFLSMIAIFPELYQCKNPRVGSALSDFFIFQDLRHPIVTFLLHLHAFLLLPLFYHLWLVQGTGNANFFYASTLVFACANGAALIDCIWAGLRIAIGKNEDSYVVVQE